MTSVLTEDGRLRCVTANRRTGAVPRLSTIRARGWATAGTRSETLSPQEMAEGRVTYGRASAATRCSAHSVARARMASSAFPAARSRVFVGMKGIADAGRAGAGSIGTRLGLVHESTGDADSRVQTGSLVFLCWCSERDTAADHTRRQLASRDGTRNGRKKKSPFLPGWARSATQRPSVDGAHATPFRILTHAVAYLLQCSQAAEQARSSCRVDRLADGRAHISPVDRSAGRWFLQAARMYIRARAVPYRLSAQP